VGEIGRTPRRFGIDAVQMRRIVATSDQRRRPVPAKRPVMPGFAERDTGFVSPRRPKAKPALRLVTSND